MDLVAVTNLHFVPAHQFLGFSLKQDNSQSGTHYIQWYPSEKQQWRHSSSSSSEAKSDDFTASPSVRVVFKI